MASDDDTRNFAPRDEAGDEPSVFSGRLPRQAALKAARRLDPADSEESAERQELRLRERGTKKVHIYEGWGWAWAEQAPDDAPGWLSGEITEANVSKQAARTYGFLRSLNLTQAPTHGLIDCIAVNAFR